MKNLFISLWVTMVVGAVCMVAAAAAYILMTYAGAEWFMGIACFIIGFCIIHAIRNSVDYDEE